MALDRSLIGIRSPAMEFEVERGAIRKFAEAIGDPNPVYQRGELAPPSFPTTFRVKLPGLDAVSPARLIHGNEEYAYERPIRAGDRLLCHREIRDLFFKQGKLGAMTFVISVIEGRDPAGELVFTGKSTLIIHGEEEHA